MHFWQRVGTDWPGTTLPHSICSHKTSPRRNFNRRLCVPHTPPSARMTCIGSRQVRSRARACDTSISTCDLHFGKMGTGVAAHFHTYLLSQKQHHVQALARSSIIHVRFWQDGDGCGTHTFTYLFIAKQHHVLRACDSSISTCSLARWGRV
jgi:hypothetical protein